MRLHPTTQNADANDGADRTVDKAAARATALLIAGSARDLAAIASAETVRQRIVEEGQWRRVDDEGLCVDRLTVDLAANAGSSDQSRAVVALAPVPKAPAFKLTIDLGHRLADGVEPASSARLDLVGGTPRALFELGKRLIVSSGGRLQMSTAEERRNPSRFIDAAFSSMRAARTIEPQARLDLSPDTTIREATCASLRATAFRVAELAPFFAETRAPRAIQQFRVALRRFRTLARVFRKPAGDVIAPLGEEARRLARLVSAARDWDVFLAQDAMRAALGAYAETGATRLYARAEHLRAIAWTRVADLAGGVAVSGFAIDLLAAAAALEAADRGNGESALDRPAAHLARRALDRRRAVAANVGRALRPDDIDAAHLLRLEVKKLRYAAQAFRGVYPGPARKAYMAAMAEFQDLFGAVNDAAVSGALAAEAAVGQGEAAARAAGFLAGLRAEESRRAVIELAERWRDFIEREPFWR